MFNFSFDIRCPEKKSNSNKVVCHSIAENVFGAPGDGTDYFQRFLSSSIFFFITFI